MIVKLMTRIDRVKEILKEMTEEEKLELIRLCNINDNQKIDDCFNTYFTEFFNITMPCKTGNKSCKQ